MNKNSSQSPNLSLRPDQIEAIISNQAKSLQVQEANIHLQEKRIRANEAIAIKSLDHQKEDRAENRKAVASQLNKLLIFFGFIIIVFCYGIGWLLTNGHKDLVWDIVKVLLGGGAGYGLGISKTKHNKDGKGDITDATTLE